MRVNEPVTNDEIEVGEGQILASRTTPDSRIVFANEAFTHISGFTEQELIGQPHNLVRHPDMPKEAFADLWATVKAGRPWEGLVKNRTKSGGFYWVRANVTPVVEDGEHKGYISVRTRASREDIAHATQAYAAMRAGRPIMALADGELVPSGPRARLATFWRSITGRLVLAFSLMAAVMLGIGGVTLIGMNDSNDALHSLYADRLVPVRQLAEIQELLHDKIEALHDADADLEAGNADKARQAVQTVATAHARMDAIWAEYMATYLTPEESRLAAEFVAKRQRFYGGPMTQALGQIQRGDHVALTTLIRTGMRAQLNELREALHALVALQQRVGKELNEEAQADFNFHMTTALALFVLALAAAALFSLWLLASLRRPMRELEAAFDAIIRGDTTGVIPLPAAREFHATIRMLRGMRARLAYAARERQEEERKTAIERRSAIQAMAGTVEAQTRSAVGDVARQTATITGEAREMNAAAERVSSNATTVAAAAEQALANAQAVGAASEQLSASINEIAAQVAQAGAVAQRAVTGGELAQQRIQSLADSAQRIGDVVQLIGSIAAQTNLLALNATIEAARAGDAGKGFAVVASEVKNLATQTARSTEEISRQIAEIQATTGSVVEAVGDIGSRIQELASVSVAVAAAVEQQASATQEIARNVAQTGAAAGEVSQRIAEVSAEAQRSGSQAASLLAGADAIAGTVAILNDSIVSAIRTATADADRRLQARHTIDGPCAVHPEGAARVDARLRDISRGGARIECASPLPVGQRGTLHIEALGRDCQARFTIADRMPDGTLRLNFQDDSLSAALVAALDRLENRGRQAA
jgi:methyl-accepting chemotaxis protein/aerotaxis receptor